MQNILKSSSKIGFIAAALLLASACGSEDVRSDVPDSPGSPLVKVEQIAPGSECEHGGSLIINGIDTDKNGELSETEIEKSKTAKICKNAPGNGNGGGENTASPLIKSETLAVGDADCPTGGQRVTAGLDINEDNELSATEIKSTTVLCNEVAACNGATPLVLISVKFEKDIFEQYQIGLEYKIRLTFNQAIDKNRVTLQDATGSLGDGPLAYEIDATNDHIAIFKWTPTVDGNPPFLAMIEDGCSMDASAGILPTAYAASAGVHVTSDVNGLRNAGDKAEICWSSRNADKCEFFEFYTLVEEIALEGCREIELTTEHINDLSPTLDYFIRCEGTTANNVTTSSQRGTNIFKQPTLEYFSGNQQLMLKPGNHSVPLYWNSFGMESCTLSDGTTTKPVEDAAPYDLDAGYITEIDKTTTFTMTCEDVLNNTHQHTVRYLVGPGVMDVYGGMYVPNSALTMSWKTIDLDGTCDVKYSNNGVTLEYTGLVADFSQIHLGFGYKNFSLYKENIDISVFDFSKEQVSKVTCHNADNSKSYSLSFTR